MKHEDVKIGMKVVPHSKSVGMPFNESLVWDKEARRKGYLYIIKASQNKTYWVLDSNYNSTDSIDGDFYNASDFEPYEEKTMTDLERVVELEKQLAELKASIAEKDKPKKNWPDSFEEAMELFSYWGMQEADGDKYIIYPDSGVDSNLKGRAFSKYFHTWTGFAGEMRKYWNGTKSGVTFKKFDKAEELWKWFAE